MTAASYSAIPEFKKEDISFTDAVKTPLAEPVNLDSEKGTFKAWFSAVKDTVSNYFESKKFDSHINNLKQFEKIDQNFAENLSAWSKVDKGMPSAEVKAVYGQVGQSLIGAAQTFKAHYDEVNRSLVNATGMTLKDITEAKHDSLTNAQKVEVNRISKEFCAVLKSDQGALKSTIEKVAVAVDGLRTAVGELSGILEEKVVNLEESSRKLRGDLGYTGYVPASPRDGMNLYTEARKEIVAALAKSDTLATKGADEYAKEIQDAKDKLAKVTVMSSYLTREIEKTYGTLGQNQQQRAYLANEFEKSPEGAQAVKVSKDLVASLSRWFDKQECRAIHGSDSPAYSTSPGPDSLRMTLGTVKNQEDLDKAQTKVDTFCEESKLNRATVNSIGKGMLSFNNLLDASGGAAVDTAFKKLVTKTQQVYEKRLIGLLNSDLEPGALRTAVQKELDSIDRTVKALKSYDEKVVKEFSAFTSKDLVTREAAKTLHAALQKDFNQIFKTVVEDQDKFNAAMEQTLERTNSSLENLKNLDQHLRNKIPAEIKSVDKEAASLIKEAQEMYVSKLKELSKESEGYDELQKSLGEALVRYAKSYDGFVQLAKSGKPNMSFAEYSDMMERLRADLDKIGGKPRFSL